MIDGIGIVIQVAFFSDTNLRNVLSWRKMISRFLKGLKVTALSCQGNRLMNGEHVMEIEWQALSPGSGEAIKCCGQMYQDMLRGELLNNRELRVFAFDFVEG
jgi:hypothetical protein